MSDVRWWHLTDLTSRAADVGSSRYSGPHAFRWQSSDASQQRDDGNAGSDRLTVPVQTSAAPGEVASPLKSRAPLVP
jgi:hypothetical protein